MMPKCDSMLLGQKVKCKAKYINIPKEFTYLPQFVHLILQHLLSQLTLNESLTQVLVLFLQLNPFFLHCLQFIMEPHRDIFGYL